MLDNFSISEDAWEEEKEYRNKVTKKILALSKLLAITKSNINSLFDRYDST